MMMTARSLNALVLAGTRPGGDPLAQHAGVSHKALIQVDGRTMIERVVAALVAVPEVKRIAIAIDRPDIVASLPGLAQCPKPLTLTPTAASPSGSVAEALTREGTPLLVTTADHALLAPEWLREFLAACPAEADVAAGLARKAAVLAHAPHAQRTFLRFDDGEFSGCNLFCFQTPAALSAVQFWQRMEAHRKSPVRMMQQLGVGTALRYRLGTLRLQEALARLESLTGAKIRIIVLSDGRAAIDVDKPADLDLVRALAVSSRAQRAPESRSSTAGCAPSRLT